MNVVASSQFEVQLKLMLSNRNPKNAKAFKLYLDTIIINLPTKAEKYKRSLYFNDDKVRDIEHQGCTIPFFEDDTTGTYVLLGIIEHVDIP